MADRGRGLNVKVTAPAFLNTWRSQGSLLLFGVKDEVEIDV